MKKSNVKILVCCHRHDTWKEDDVYLPIHVGKAISNVDLGIQGDDTGDNISNKNKSYCELTGMYWAWKNMPVVEYIGLCHYRRYFNFNEKGLHFTDHTKISTNEFEKLNLSTPNFDKIFSNHDIILVKPKIYAEDLFKNYSSCHNSEDARTIEKIVLSKHPQYKEALNDRIHNSNKISHYNMFIMSWSNFDKYCSWLFPILNEAEQKINIENYNDVQKRIWGYIAERLLLVYVHHNKMKIKHYPIYFIDDMHKNQPFISRFQRQLRSNLAFNLIKRRLRNKE